MTKRLNIAQLRTSCYQSTYKHRILIVRIIKPYSKLILVGGGSPNKWKSSRHLQPMVSLAHHTDQRTAPKHSDPQVARGIDTQKTRAKNAHKITKLISFVKIM